MLPEHTVERVVKQHLEPAIAGQDGNHQVVEPEYFDGQLVDLIGDNENNALRDGQERKYRALDHGDDDSDHEFSEAGSDTVWHLTFAWRFARPCKMPPILTTRIRQRALGILRLHHRWGAGVLAMPPTFLNLAAL